MDLTEYSVNVLVDYLYSGQISIPSDISSLLEVAVAAQCFQLQVCVSSSLRIISWSYQEVIDWIFEIISSNMSNIVWMKKEYDKMDKLTFLFHIKSLNIKSWEEIRFLFSYLCF